MPPASYLPRKFSIRLALVVWIQAEIVMLLVSCSLASLGTITMLAKPLKLSAWFTRPGTEVAPSTRPFSPWPDLSSATGPVMSAESKDHRAAGPPDPGVGVGVGVGTG